MGRELDAPGGPVVIFHGDPCEYNNLELDRFYKPFSHLLLHISLECLILHHQECLFMNRIFQISAVAGLTPIFASNFGAPLSVGR